jgi:hypothetical protein
MLTCLSNIRKFFQAQIFNRTGNMADADGKMKDLSISETKKKKDGNPTKTPKKPQQQKKKVGVGISYTGSKMFTKV